MRAHPRRRVFPRQKIIQSHAGYDPSDDVAARPRGGHRRQAAVAGYVQPFARLHAASLARASSASLASSGFRSASRMNCAAMLPAKNSVWRRPPSQSQRPGETGDAQIDCGEV